MIADILAIAQVEADEFGANLGIRMDDAAYAVGEILPASRVWDDGEPTEDEMGGTSAVEVCRERIPTEADVARALKASRIYIGRYLYVLTADNCGWGEDAGEIVMRKARVLAVIDTAA